MTPTVRAFAEHEWPVYRYLRLAALADSPDAFGSTLAHESQRPDPEWANRLAAGVRSDWDLPVMAEVDGLPVGLAWGRIEETDRAVAHLYQVWVHPGYRGCGAGQLLLNTIIAWAKDRQAEYLELGVTQGDTPAMRLYVRAGFEPAGPPEPLRPGSAFLAQAMRLKLSGQDA